MATLRVNESRPAELSQQPEASLAWWWATSTAKRRQRVPMPCDRAPKSEVAGATVVDPSGGRAEAPQWLGASRSYRGPRAGRRDMRVAREPERPGRFHRHLRLGNRNTNSPCPRPCAPAGGSESGARVVSPSEGNETRRDGRQGVGASHSSDEAGELDRRTPRSEGDAVSNDRWRETWRVHRNPWTCPRNDNG
jgi:hypothetical protein